MQEPSVLDYVKSKLNPRRGRIEIPERPSEPAPEPVAQPRPWPWRSLLALLLALAGQRAFEPASRSAAVGLALYALALGLLVWAGRRNEWGLADPHTGRSQPDALQVRALPLVLSLLLAGLAFLSFGELQLPGSRVVLFEDNLFTGLNLSLWLGSIGLFLYAVWRRDPDAVPLRERLGAFFARPAWGVAFTRWSLLVLAVTGVVLFFRLYQINSVPIEPFSDHAEKLLDVYDLVNGRAQIFFPRNTGREALQFYWTALVARVFGTGLSFLSLKLGTALLGLLMLPYMYLLGQELGGRRVALLALLIAGVAYWPNVISRVGLRFPLYPLFLAPVLYHLLRALRDGDRNQFLLAGLFLGLGLHGYTPFRIVPVVVVFATGLYLLHRASRGMRAQIAGGLVLLAFTSLLVFLPLLRYGLAHPGALTMRTLTRMTDMEQAIAGPVGQVLASNLWNAARMFHWDDGEIWVNSVMHRPALDLVTAALFTLGAALALLRYFKTREWVYLFLLLSIPLLQLPSSLALAFPNENPAINRAGGAMIPIFLLAALALDGLIAAIERAWNGTHRALVLTAALGLLAVIMLPQNYDLVFRQYAWQMKQSIWNTSDMGRVIQQFNYTYGEEDNAWIVPYPYWVDTRLPGAYIGQPQRDFALWPQDLHTSQAFGGPKLFILNPNDLEAIAILRDLYPQGAFGRFVADVPGHDFLTYFVPPGGPVP